MSNLKALWLPPILSAFLATTASGLYTTLTSLQLAGLNLSGLENGLLFAIYFIGLSLGTLTAARVITSCGHRKTYLLLCLGLVASLLFECLSTDTALWFVARGLIGFFTGISFVVYETWINHYSPQRHRALLFSLYIAVYYASLAAGQLFLSLSLQHADWLYEIIITLSVFSALPIGLIHVPKQYHNEMSTFRLSHIKNVPLISQIGCLSSGVLTGAILSLLPFLLAKNQYVETDIALLMLFTLLSGTLPQFGIGFLLSRINNKLLLTGISLITICMALLESTQSHLLILTALSVVLGSMVFSIYPVCVSYALQFCKTTEITNTNTILLFSYSFGTSIGPLLGSIWMGLAGDDGYYYFLCIFPTVMLATCWYKRNQIPVAR